MSPGRCHSSVGPSRECGSGILPELEAERLAVGKQRMQALDHAIQRGREDIVPRAPRRKIAKRERLEALAAKMREKYARLAAREEAAARPVPVSHATLYGVTRRGMPWLRECFLCGNPAWCRHREQQLISLYAPPPKWGSARYDSQ